MKIPEVLDNRWPSVVNYGLGTAAVGNTVVITCNQAFDVWSALGLATSIYLFGQYFMKKRHNAQEELWDGWHSDPHEEPAHPRGVSVYFEQNEWPGSRQWHRRNHEREESPPQRSCS